MRCGVPYDLFWVLCAKEVFYFVEAFNEQLQHDHFNSVQNAWLSVALDRTKKLPKLHKLLGKSHSKKRIKIQTMNEMLKKIELINMQFGGKDLRHGDNR